MRKYGGFIADASERKGRIEERENHKYEFMGEYKHLPERFINEVWNRADEYQKMFEDATQVNKKLIDKQEKQERKIAVLEAQLAASQKTVAEKDFQLEELKEKAMKHEALSQLWEDQLELQDLKTERAHERRIEEEEKVEKLETKCSKFQKELVTSSNKGKFFETRIIYLQSKVTEVIKELEEKEKNLDKMKVKAEELNKLVREANEKVQNHKTINKSNEIIVEYRRKMSLLQQRHSDIRELLQKLEIQIGIESNGKCWKRRNSFEEITMGLLGKLFGLLDGSFYGNSPW